MAVRVNTQAVTHVMEHINEAVDVLVKPDATFQDLLRVWSRVINLQVFLISVFDECKTDDIPIGMNVLAEDLPIHLGGTKE